MEENKKLKENIEKEKLKDSKELSNKEDKEIEKVIEKDNENEKLILKKKIKKRKRQIIN